MPGIDELLRAESERWRAEIDAEHETPEHGTPEDEAPSAATRRPRIRLSRRAWTVSIGGVAAAAVVVLAVGLHSGSGSGSNGAEYPSRAGGAAKVPADGNLAAAAPADSDAGSDGATGSGGVGSASSTSKTGTSTAAPTSAALILTGSVSLTVADNANVDRAAARAIGIADGAGGRVDTDSRTSDGGHSANLVLRVPNSALPGVTRQLGQLGTLTAQDLSTKDVTSQVADVDSRVTSARAAITGLDRLYAKANTVSDLIAVESALTARQADLEALEAQQRTLSAQTSLATLTLSIDVRVTARQHHKHHSGFVGGLHRGWDAFTGAAGAVATGLGAVVPFAALALLVGGAAALVLRRRRAAATPPAEQ